MFTLQFNFLPVEPLRVDDVYTDSASDSESEYETRGSSSIDGELHLLVLSYFVHRHPFWAKIDLEGGKPCVITT